VGRRTGRTLPVEPYLPGRGTRPDEGWLVDDAPMAWACDLFDAGHHWLAHEVWEQLWMEEPREADRARFFQGLLLAAASLVKQDLGFPDSAEELFFEAVSALEDAMHGLGEVVDGVDLLHFVAIVDHALHDGPAPHVPDGSGEG
jgi:hypothetical protein